MTFTTQEKSIKAQQLLNDALVQEIFSDLERRYITEWRGTGPGEGEKREMAHAAVRAIDDFRARLSALVSAPRVDAHNNRGAGKRQG